MRIAVAGLGTIGRALSRRLADGVDGLTLAAVAARDEEKARGWLDEEGIEVPSVPLSEMPQHADLVVECAPAKIIEEICRPMLSAGKQVMVLSCGALLPRPELLELAKANGGRIVVPTGGLLGLDAVAAAAEGTINSVKMTTRKPPNGLAGAPHLVKNGISVEGLNEPKLVFSGTARDAAAGFPANVNVVAALALAGIGPDRTMIDIYADRPRRETVTSSRWMRTRHRSRSRSRTCHRRTRRLARSLPSPSSRPCASLPRRCASERNVSKELSRPEFRCGAREPQ